MRHDRAPLADANLRGDDRHIGRYALGCGHEHFAMGPVCHLCYKADASHEQCRFGPILRAWQELRLATEHGFWELVCFSVEFRDAVRGVFFSVASPARSVCDVKPLLALEGGNLHGTHWATSARGTRTLEARGRTTGERFNFKIERGAVPPTTPDKRAVTVSGKHLSCHYRDFKARRTWSKCAGWVRFAARKTVSCADVK
jgi:hypothetical protein